MPQGGGDGRNHRTVCKLFFLTMTNSSRQPVSVAQLTSKIRARLNNDFAGIWVRGEVTGLMRARSGHLYFNLKDESAQISAMVWQSNAWRLKFELKDGMEVVCLGDVDVYPPRGSYQLSIREIHEVGVGARQLALRKLHEKLNAKGWFDASRKKRLPRIPRRVAVVTSPAGAAIRDFLQVAQRRWPFVKIVVVPTAVQGEDAGRQIAAAIRRAAGIAPALDAIVVTRGGGSAEDLWCFNDEAVCESIFHATVPVISAVGHEIDVSLCDLVADVRALTPSEAAERLVPDQAEVRGQLNNQRERLRKSLLNQLDRAKLKLDSLANRSVLARPLDRLREQSIRLDLINERLKRHAESQLQGNQKRLAELATRLDSLSPLATLSRGYSLTTIDGKVIQSSDQVSPGDLIETKVENGSVKSRVESCD